MLDALREHIRGEVTTQISEHMARGFYRRWESYMNGAGWGELLGEGDPRFASFGRAAADEKEAGRE